MARRAWTIILLAVVAGCSSTRLSPPAPSGAAGPELTFVVREAGRLPLRGLSGVTVIAIGKDGSSSTLGNTFDGRLTVAKELLFRNGPQAVLFCLEGYQCGALWLDAPEWKNTSLAAFTEYNVDLAPFVLYD